jgi:hypothetical protein
MSHPKARSTVDRAVPRVDDPSPVDTPSMRRLATFGWILLLLLAGAYLSSFVGLRTPMRDLPEPQRKLLFERTQATVRDVCAPGVAESIHAFCRQQAELLLQFPECEADCQGLAKAHLSHRGR